MGLLIWSSSDAQAAVLDVGKPGASYATVQSAIAHAQSGDTIRVHPGVYVGNLNLDKTLRIQGLGRPVIRGEGTGSVVRITAPRCQILGFVLEHSGSELQGEDSGILVKAAECRLENNDLRDVLYGIYLMRAKGSFILGNRIRGRKELPLGERGAGLHLWDAPENVIEDNTISEARDGLYIQSSPGNRIRRNKVFNVRYGVHYMFSDTNSFEENIFTDNVAGAAIMYSSDIEFRRNVFMHNRGFSSFGILFQDCERCTAEGNFIIDNATGIFMEALCKSTFRSNVIAENDVALQVFASADDNLFSGNNFVQNLSPMRLIGRSTTTRWGEGGRGNYWSEYEGYDLDADGVGDVPHRIQNVFDYMEGNYPRLRLYLVSPAAQAIATAEKIFPVLHGSGDADSAPLMKSLSLRFAGTTGNPGTPGGPTRLILSALCLGMLAIGLVTFRWGLRR